MKQTILLLSQFGTITPFAEKYLLEHLREQHFAKDEMILHAGKTARRIYFIDYGLIRHFIDTPNSESTIWLLVKNAIVVAFDSFFEQIASDENIQALLPTLTYSITREELDYLTGNDIEFYKINERIQKFYRSLQSDYNLMIRKPEEERYNWLLEKHSHLLNMAPNPILASFLNMGKHTFYKIRRNRSNRNPRK